MDNESFELLLKSLGEAKAFAKGKPKRGTKAKDVKKIRGSLA